MQIAILLEPVANNGYRASSGPPLALSAEGATREEAIRNLQHQLQQRLTNGVEVITTEVPAQAVENPWAKYAGMFKIDPMFDEVVDLMKKRRQQDEADPDYL